MELEIYVATTNNYREQLMHSQISLFSLHIAYSSKAQGKLFFHTTKLGAYLSLLRSIDKRERGIGNGSRDATQFAYVT